MALPKWAPPPRPCCCPLPGRTTLERAARRRPDYGLRDGATLTRAVESALGQSDPADAIWIGDDASTDATAAIAKGYMDRFPSTIRYLRHERRLGVSANRNLLAERCDCDWLVHLDGDDALSADALGAARRTIAARPDAGFVFGNHEIVTPDGARVSW